LGLPLIKELTRIGAIFSQNFFSFFKRDCPPISAILAYVRGDTGGREGAVPHARGVYTPGVRGYNYPQVIHKLLTPPT